MPEPRVQPLQQAVTAEPHTAVYKMHRYFARRPHNVFRRLVEHYTQPGDIVLDPFCGGGVTVVEALRLRRRVVAVDLDPMATFITRMQVIPAELGGITEAYECIRAKCEKPINDLYLTRCPHCRACTPTDWVEWSPVQEQHNQEKLPPHVRFATQTWHPVRVKLNCQCGFRGEKKPDREDETKPKSIDDTFDTSVKSLDLWYPRNAIPLGEKTREPLSKGFQFFHQLFTKRNLLALAMLLQAVEKATGETERSLMELAFSSRLFESSRLAHVKHGTVVKPGHHYWPPSRSVEANVWKQFLNGYKALVRGKLYASREIAPFYSEAERFEDLQRGATYWVLNRSSTRLPLPDGSVDAVITDPPYGGNINYSELSNFWAVWLRRSLGLDGLIENVEEAIVNRYQGKGFAEYKELLAKVFGECHRALKPDGWLVVTFHSAEARAWAALQAALGGAGFDVGEASLLYQPPIHSYTTTLHQRRPGAILGDFIISLRRTHCLPAQAKPRRLSVETCVHKAAAQATHGGHGASISDVYRYLIPLLFASGLLTAVSRREVENLLKTCFVNRDGLWYLA